MTDLKYKLLAMLSAQDALNTKFIGKVVENLRADQTELLDATNPGYKITFARDGWKGLARLHTVVDYRMAILDEAGELIRSDTYWKFWKGKREQDFQNLVLEYIDILHFAMSEALAIRLYKTTSAVEDDMETGYALALRNVKADGGMCSVNKAKGHLFDFLSKLSAVGHDLIPSPVIDWQAFWSIGLHLDIDFPTVYRVYVGKSALNALRIAKGDSEGRYKREWWGKEDNEYLMQAALDKSICLETQEDFLTHLEAMYDTFLNSTTN